jgi:hypothetical protein
LDNCADHGIHSLTLLMNDPIPTNPYYPEDAKRMAEARLATLRRLCPRIKLMRLAVLSIWVDIPFPYSAAPEISSILDNLTVSCIGLEIDMRHNSSTSTSRSYRHALPNSPHLCNSIRAILPRLRHLRLRLPLICPAIFSVTAPSQGSDLKVLLAPMLRTCVINLSLRAPGHRFQGAWATTCSDEIDRTPYVGFQDELPSALPPLLPVLRDFVRLNSRSIERFWVIDVEVWDTTLSHSWRAWVRRDFISNASFPVPLTNSSGYRRDAWLARVPSPTGQGNANDQLSSLRKLEAAAEGNTWVDTTSGARLPMAMLREHQDTCPAPLSRARFQEHDKLTCVLWINEDLTGQKLLPEGPGELMKQWDVKEITPSGWIRHADPDSPLVRGMTRCQRTAL